MKFINPMYQKTYDKNNHVFSASKKHRQIAIKNLLKDGFVNPWEGFALFIITNGKKVKSYFS